MSEITTKAEAAAEMARLLGLASIENLIELCQHALKLATPIAAWNMGLALKELANRLDQRSFANVCELIRSGGNLPGYLPVRGVA